MVNIDLIELPRHAQGRRVKTHQHCKVHWHTKRRMPTSQMAGFDAEAGHINGLLNGLVQFPAWGSVAVVVTTEGRSTMEGTFETYFPETVRGLHGALGTIDAFCRNFFDLAPGSTFTVTFDVNQTCEIIEMS